MFSRFTLKPDNFPANKDYQSAQAHPAQIAARMAGQERAGGIVEATEN